MNILLIICPIITTICIAYVAVVTVGDRYTIKIKSKPEGNRAAFFKHYSAQYKLKRWWFFEIELYLGKVKSIRIVLDGSFHITRNLMPRMERTQALLYCVQFLQEIQQGGKNFVTENSQVVAARIIILLDGLVAGHWDDGVDKGPSLPHSTKNK